MKHRERMQTALNHQEPDRIPIDLGASCVTSISVSTYKKLRNYLGLTKKEIPLADMVQQLAWVDEDILELYGVDVIPVWANNPSGYTAEIVDDGENGTYFFDEFGAKMKMPINGYYYDWSEFPLSKPSIELLESMPWPDPADTARYKGLRESTLKLRNNTDYALFGMAPCGHDLFNQLFRVRGMVEGMMDLLTDLDFVEAFFDRLTETIMKAQELFLNEVGDLIDIHFTADDISGQSGPLFSPELYRKLIKPRWAKIISLIKSKTKAKIFYHTCGSVYQFLPDLIEIGVDILNPVQVTAVGMDSLELKRRFGDKLSFWGGGCDTQKILPFGSSAEIREEVKRRIRDLAPGGGFVFNPVHNIQPNVSAENIDIMYKTAKEYGVYKKTIPA